MINCCSLITNFLKLQDTKALKEIIKMWWEQILCSGKQN